MTDETSTPTTPGPDHPDHQPEDAAPPRQAGRPSSSADVRGRRPDYRGEELDPERGPGLGCFWFQVFVLGFFIVIIPVGLSLNWPFELLAILLFIVIGLLLLTGQTVIFLLRLVAADRRAAGRRRPLASPTKTVGEIEDDVAPTAPLEPPEVVVAPTAPLEPPEPSEPTAVVQPMEPAEPSEPTAPVVAPVEPPEAVVDADEASAADG